MAIKKYETSEHDKAFAGGLYAAAAFLIWGSFPVYYKLVEVTPTLELLCHRISWSAVVPIIIIVLFKKWHAVQRVLNNRSTLLMLCFSTLMIAGNWYLFIWAATNERVLDSSLGYFITPLLSVALGVVVLKEKLRPFRLVAISIAALGVAVLIFRFGQVPWLALAIAVTFSSYSLIRKVANVDPITGLFFETVMSLPITAAYLGYLGFVGTGSFGAAGINFSLLLIGVGLISTLPLLFFISGTKRLNLSTIGFFQYLLPTCHFVLAIWLYEEPFSVTQLMSFAFIWVALAVFSFDVIRVSGRSGATV